MHPLRPLCGKMSHAGCDNGCDELLVPLDRLITGFGLVSLCSMLLPWLDLLVYIYYLRKGQFEDPEDVKYQMFREDER